MKTKLIKQIVGSGPDLILIHGWGWTSTIWKQLVSDLQKNFRITIFDLPGYASNRKLKHSDCLSEIANQIVQDISFPAYWLGWSLGGVITLKIALDYPHYVKKLIIVGTSPKFIAEKDWPGISENIFQEFFSHLQKDPYTTLIEFLYLQLLGLKDSRKWAQQLKNEYSISEIDPKALQAGLFLLKDTDFRQQLSKITCPTLHILGGKDQIIPVKMVNHLSTLVQHQIQIIPDATHIPFLTHSKLFKDEMMRFFNNEVST